MKEIEVSGIDTIQELSKPPPMEIEVPYSVEYKQQMLLGGWNAAYIAILPYCFVCRRPLVWHTHPQGKTLFHCDKCGRKWIKEEGWDKHG